MPSAPLPPRKSTGSSDEVGLSKRRSIIRKNLREGCARSGAERFGVVMGCSAMSEPAAGRSMAETVGTSCVRRDKVCEARGLVLFTSAMKEGGGGRGGEVNAECGGRVNPTLDCL